MTSNWDLVIERYAQLHSIPLRLSGSGDASEVTLIKLHGSIDWCLGKDKTPSYPVDDYASLRERLFGSRSYKATLPSGSSLAETIVRVRALERWNDLWRRVKSRIIEPYIVTMARGKAGDLGPLRGLWRDAYVALSRATTLEIVGYSVPDDDSEIRGLLRASIQRGTGPKEVVVTNPAPDVHERVRRYLQRSVKSVYVPVR